MGNSLLDFVMALVRDPEVSARYAADPAAVLADAHLAGVTTEDVDNLIPVVTDSLAAATPAFGAAAEPGNVWTSGAAVAAFDAFDIPVAPIRHPEPHQPAVTLPPVAPHMPIDAYSSAESAPAPVPDEAAVHLPIEAVSPDLIDSVGVAVWRHPGVDPLADRHPGDPAGFDLV